MLTGEGHLVIDDSLDFRANRSALQRVFENLFRNAVEHAEPAVTVHVGPSADKSGFYVVDDGPGIPAQIRDSLFEPGVSTNDADTASGYGLAIVREITDAHGWDLVVTESRDGGTRISITGGR